MRKSIISAVFAALICAGWMMAIPVGHIPIVLQNALAVLAGLLLGPLFGGLSVLLFLVAGAVGLPVFSGGSGGFAVFAGPTGGFLVGYLAAAIVGGFIMKLYRAEQRWPLSCGIIAVAGLLSFLSIYVFGLLWFKHALNLSWQHTFLKGFVPFILPDLIKLVVVVPITLKLRPIIRRYME